jgi:hypothetical protein
VVPRPDDRSAALDRAGLIVAATGIVSASAVSPALDERSELAFLLASGATR